MPILSPLDLRSALRSISTSRSDSTLKQKLDDAGLDEIEILNSLAEVMRGADTSATRLQAIKTACELHGMLESESVKPVPIVNIIISDSEVGSINPIFIPREGGV